MISLNRLAGLDLELLRDTVLPDFVLAFTFFVALCYAVLGRQFGRQRLAMAMSVALGTALAIGLVWWQERHGYSARDLGPLAVGLALLVLAGVVYTAIGHLGGNWAGFTLALAVALLVGSVVGGPWPVESGPVATVGMIILLVGVLALVTHRRLALTALPPQTEVTQARCDLRDLEQDRRVAEHLGSELRQLRTEADFLITRPDVAGDFRTQLHRLLPEQGWLTERLARLRASTHHARAGHLARIRELRGLIDGLPPEARAQAAQELAARYAELRLDARLERLDRAVAEVERRIRDLTARAESCVANHDYPQVERLLDEAARLQEHNTKLIRLIERTEQRLLDTARPILARHGEVSGA